jgi:hypothetical protein
MELESALSRRDLRHLHCPVRANPLINVDSVRPDWGRAVADANVRLWQFFSRRGCAFDRPNSRSAIGKVRDRPDGNVGSRWLWFPSEIGKCVSDHMAREFEVSFTTVDTVKTNDDSFLNCLSEVFERFWRAILLWASTIEKRFSDFWRISLISHWKSSGMQLLLNPSWQEYYSNLIFNDRAF